MNVSRQTVKLADTAASLAMALLYFMRPVSRFLQGITLIPQIRLHKRGFKIVSKYFPVTISDTGAALYVMSGCIVLITCLTQVFRLIFIHLEAGIAAAITTSR